MHVELTDPIYIRIEREIRAAREQHKKIKRIVLDQDEWLEFTRFIASLPLHQCLLSNGGFIYSGVQIEPEKQKDTSYQRFMKRQTSINF